MADHIEILDTQLDPDAPVTSGLAFQIRDNPIAMAEGANGAPRVQGKALGGMFLGSDTLSAEWLNLDGHGWILFNVLFVAASNGSVNVRLSNDNGTNWGAWQQVGTAGGPDNISGTVRVSIETGDAHGQFIGATTPATSSTASIVVPASANAIQMQFTGVATSSAVDAIAMGGLEL